MADAFAVLVVFLGYTALGLTGFGSALVIVPLLAWRWPLAEVVPTVLALDLLATVLLGVRHRGAVARDELLRLLPWLLGGTLAGAAFANNLDRAAGMTALGAFVALVASGGGRARRAPAGVVGPRWAIVAGLAAGMVESLFGTSGPVIVAYLAQRIVEPARLRVTIAAVLLVGVVGALGSLALAGALRSAWGWPWLLAMAVAAQAGVRLGDRLAHRVPAQAWHGVMRWALVLSGASLCARGLLA